MTDIELKELLLKYHTALKVAKTILSNENPDITALKLIIDNALTL